MSVDRNTTEAIYRSLLPWSQRQNGIDWWEGMTERQALDHAQRIHQSIQRDGLSSFDNDQMVARAFPSMNNAEVRDFTNWSRNRRNPVSKVAAFGIPHTAGSESIFRTLMDESGNLSQSWPKHTNTHDATDIEAKLGDRSVLVDHQNKVIRKKDLHDPMISLGAIKNVKDDPRLPQEMFEQAPGNKTIGEIIERTKSEARNIDSTYGDDKLLQSTASRINPASARDGNMTNRPGVYRKDYIVGGVYDVNQVQNITGNRNLGSYDPKMPSRGYAIDLNALRSNMADMPKRDFLDLGGQIYQVPQGQRGNGKLTFRLPQSFTDRFGRGQQAFDELISPDVWNEARRFASGNEFRSAAGSIEQAEGLLKGAVKGRLGGLANVALNGASRETGKRIAKGDYVGAATEFGKDYAIGAAADVGLRKAGQAILTRLPAALAKGAAGTVSSGGWAAPMAAAYTAYEVADGAVEGFTGKGLSTRMEEASDNAVTSAYERKFNQPAPKGGFVPKDKPLVQAKPQRAPTSLENINSAVKAVSEIAPEVKAQPAQITQATPQVTKPDTGNFLSQWTNKVKSWFQ